MAAAKPDSMSQKAWDYLLNFTETHEHPVLHMYNNRKTEGDKQDVTFGIGVQINSPAAALAHRRYFSDKSGGQASDAAIVSDWNEVSKILRTSASVQAYENATQCRVTKESARELMGNKLRGNLTENLKKKSQLATFIAMPEQAQIALASYFYGAALPTLMGRATEKWDFYEAGVQSFLRGMSDRKFKSHIILFQNAAQIVAQNLDYSQLPTGVDLPSALPETVDRETAKKSGQEMSDAKRLAKSLFPFVLSPLHFPLPPLGFGDKL